MNDPELDELLRPTVQDNAGVPGLLPWRLQSQFWVAFFGGAFAIAAIAFLNSFRLGVDAKKRWLIAILGLAGVIATAVAYFYTDSRTEHRVVTRVIAVLFFLVLRLPQKAADDHHQVFRGGRYASLWGAGVIAAIAGGLVNLGLLQWMKDLR